MLAIASYRLQRLLRKCYLPGKILAEILYIIIRSITNCHIDPRAVIGKKLLLPHPTGIVISRHAIIGNYVTIYQNVTIGSRNNRAPIIGDCVNIYAGAVVAGGIRIGDRSRIGANALVLKDMKNDNIALTPHARIIQDGKGKQ